MNFVTLFGYHAVAFAIQVSVVLQTYSGYSQEIVFNLEQECYKSINTGLFQSAVQVEHADVLVYQILGYSYDPACPITSYAVTDASNGASTLSFSTITHPSATCAAGSICDYIDINTSSMGQLYFNIDVVPN